MNSKTTSPASKSPKSQNLIPERRFPEFQRAGTWEEKPLSRFLSPVVRERLKSSEPYKGLGLRSHGKGTFLKENEDPAKNAMDVLFEVKRDDLIVNITFAWEGAIAIAGRADDGALVSHRFPTFTFVKGQALPEFFRYRILEKQFVYSLGVISPGGAGRNRVMSKTDFLKLKVLLPNTDEQKKIADCLASADALIEVQGRKVEALRAHKKGLMQQLFPQEGETQPRLRFPEFEGTGGWEFVNLGKLLKASPDYGVSEAAVPYDADLPKYLRITDISEDGRYLEENKVSVDITPNAGDYLDEGDIAIARTGASVGKSYRYRRDDGKLVFAGFLIRLRPNQRKLVTAYLTQYLTTSQYWDWISVNSARSGQPGINSSELGSLPVPLPLDDRLLREQCRIADCLTSLDNLIAVETRKLDTLKTHKKGLMQQLFPQVGEE